MDDTLVKNQVVSLIRAHLGSMTADMYKSFYQDKSGAIVLSSAQELLSEVIGEEKAEREIKDNVTTL